MAKIVARRNVDGQIVMLPKPIAAYDLNVGDIRFYRQKYQECRRPGLIHYYWHDVTAEVAAVLRQTFAPPDARARHTGADAMTRPTLLIIALLLALALVACGGGNDTPPWRMTIEAKCAAPAACPTFAPWDGTPRPTAVTTPPPGVPTATAAPQEEPTP